MHATPNFQNLAMWNDIRSYSLLAAFFYSDRPTATSSGTTVAFLNSRRIQSDRSDFALTHW